MSKWDEFTINHGVIRWLVWHKVNLLGLPAGFSKRWLFRSSRPGGVNYVGRNVFTGEIEAHVNISWPVRTQTLHEDPETGIVTVRGELSGPS